MSANIKDHGLGLYHIPVNEIQVVTNIRKTFDEESLNELAESIKTYGILQPLVVRPLASKSESPSIHGQWDRFVLVAGERRLRAAKIAGLTCVPCRVVRLGEKQAAEVQLLENLQRQDLNPLEEAEALASLLKEHDYTQEQLAGKLGKSQPWIASRVRLLRLPEAVREKIPRGIINASAAEVMIPFAEKSPQAIEAVVQQMEQRSIPVSRLKQELEHAAKQAGRPLSMPGYGSYVPKFDLEQCRSCVKVMYIQERVWSDIEPEAKPWCTNPECWDAKQNVVQESEKARPDVVDTRNLSHNDYRYMYEGPRHECEGCDNKKTSVGSGTSVCLDPPCYERLLRDERKAKKEAEEQAISDVVDKVVTECDTQLYIGALVRLPRRLLMTLAAIILLEVRPQTYINKDKWRKERLDWPDEHDWSLAGEEWTKLRDALSKLGAWDLASLIIEWIAIAKAADKKTEWLEYLIKDSGLRKNLEVPESA